MVQTILQYFGLFIIALLVAIPLICIILYRRRRRRTCLVLSYLWCAVAFWLLGVYTKNTFARCDERLECASDAVQLLHSAQAIREGRVKEGLAWLDSCLAGTLYRTAYDTPDGKMATTNMGVLEAWRIAKEYYETYDVNDSSEFTGIPQVRRKLAYVPWSDMQLAIKKFEQTYRKGTRVAAPAINMKSWIAEPMSGDSLKGKVILLNFWNIGCGPCIKSLPDLQKMYDSYKDRGLVILTCAGGDEKETRAYLNKRGYHFPAGMASWQMYLDYAVRGNPSYFLIDRDGCLAWGPEHRLPTDDELMGLLETKTCRDAKSCVSTGGGAREPGRTEAGLRGLPAAARAGAMGAESPGDGALQGRGRFHRAALSRSQPEPEETVSLKECCRRGFHSL